MANYNTGKKYNVGSKLVTGFRYNSAPYSIVLKIGEEITLSEDCRLALAKYLLMESFKVSDLSELFAKYEFIGNWLFQAETIEQRTFMSVLETVGAKDIISNFLVNQFLNEDLSLIEQLQAITQMILQENMYLPEEITLKSIYDIAEQMQLPEVNNLIARIFAFQELNIIDREPKTSISDFYIVKSADGAFDILMPFGFKVDWGKTLMNFMPEASDTSIELPGVDGEYVQDTVYKARTFDIVSYSEPGITTEERNYLKTKIANTLELIKKNKKKLTIGSADTSFDVKYSGVATIDDSRGNYIKLDLPLKATNPYAYGEFENTLKGSGLLVNNGIVATGARFEIIGPFTNANLLLGSTLLSWQGTIAANEKLVIDTENFTCFKVDANNIKTNAMATFNGNFPKIPRGSITLECNANINALTTTHWRDKFIWGKHSETF